MSFFLIRMVTSISDFGSKHTLSRFKCPLPSYLGTMTCSPQVTTGQTSKLPGLASVPNNLESIQFLLPNVSLYAATQMMLTRLLESTMGPIEKTCSSKAKLVRSLVKMLHTSLLVCMLLALMLPAPRGKSHGVEDLTNPPILFPGQTHHGARSGSGLAPQRRMRSAPPGNVHDMNPC